ncbi:hypothetical protein [Streptomyces sp. AA1529]|uniref:hypothetical protein n=1 Tax=Streptomyces sp. AA1529 TaxID=1203257 RepID=UPI0002F28CB3|nr:hypothetical protein [Streptomyces sp. AA1529]
MSHPQTAPRTGTPSSFPDSGHPAGQPVRKPGVLVALLAATALSAVSGAVGALLVYVGGKDLADRNVRNAVDGDPTAVGLPAGTDASDIAEMTRIAWDDVVTEWQSTMSARAAIALALALALLVAGLFVGSRCTLWARILLTVLAVGGAAFPHLLILRDAAPAGPYATSLIAAAPALLAAVLCWLPQVGRYREAVRGR